MHKIEVGKPYNPSMPAWPEVVQYNYRGGGHELVLFWNDISDQDLNAVRNGKLQIGLYIKQPVIFFLYRFETTDWSDAPFTMHLVPEHERIIQYEPNTRQLLQVYLVEANTGITRAIRAVSMSPQFCDILLPSIALQFDMPFNPNEYQSAIDRQYAAFPHSRDMAQRAIIKETAGAI